MVKSKNVVKAPNEVERKIHFFSYKLTYGIGGSKVVVDPSVILKEVNKLGYSDDGRYLPYPQSKELAIFDFKEKENAIYGQIAFIRRGAKPSVERRGTGKVKPIDTLIPEDGLVELTHFVFYIADHILAIEYNHFGPRANALAYYLTRKLPNFVDDTNFSYITDKDFQKRLSRIDTENIKAATFKVSVDKISEIKNIDTPLFEAMEAASKVASFEEVTLMLGPSKRSRKKFTMGGLLHRIGTALKGEEGERNEIFSEILIHGKEKDSTEEAVIFDLLEEHLVSTVKVVKMNSHNGISPEDIFHKIDSAFFEKRSLLLPYVGKIEEL